MSGSDTTLIALLEGKNYEGFLKFLSEQLKGSSNLYKKVQSDVSLCLLTMMSSTERLEFLLKCIELLSTQLKFESCQEPLVEGMLGESIKSIDEAQTGSEMNKAIGSLIMDLVPAATPSEASEFSKQAVEVFSSLCNKANARLALRIAQAYSIKLEDLPSEEFLMNFLNELFTEKATYAAGAGFIMHFKEVEKLLNRKEILHNLVEHGQDSLSEKWCGSLSQEWKEYHVELCIKHGRLKGAVKAVRLWRLAARFPDVEGLAVRRGLAQLVDKRKWGVAAGFVGCDPELQRALLKDLCMAGEASLAEEYRQQWSLPADTVEISPEALAAEIKQRLSTYLELGLSADAIVIVDTPKKAQAARPILAAAGAVGIDVEWKPTRLGYSSKASILQIATSDHAFIFDLMALGSDASLDTCLGQVLPNPRVMKLGLEVSGDLRKLAASYPDVKAFAHVLNVLDLRDLWKAVGSYAKNVDKAQCSSSAGLSTFCQSLLGKPLDKAMQTSNWENRPLTSRQVEYAAQDAHVSLRLYNAMKLHFPKDFNPLQIAKAVALRITFDTLRMPNPSQQPSHSKSPPSQSAPLTAEYNGVDNDDEDNGGDEDDGQKRDPGSVSGSDNVPASTPGRLQITAVRAQRDRQEPVSLRIPSALDDRGVGGSAVHLRSYGTSCLSRHLSSLSSSIAPNIPAPVCLTLGRFGWDGLIRRVENDASDSSLATASSAASTLGVPASHIAKSIALLVSGNPWLCVMRGDMRLNMHKVATELHMPRRSIKVASPQECQRIFGYTVGTLPPFGHTPEVHVLLDTHLRLCDLHTEPATRGTSGTTEAQPTSAALFSEPHAQGFTNLSASSPDVRGLEHIFCGAVPIEETQMTGDEPQCAFSSNVGAREDFAAPAGVAATSLVCERVPCSSSTGVNAMLEGHFEPDVCVKEAAVTLCSVDICGTDGDNGAPHLSVSLSSEYSRKISWSGWHPQTVSTQVGISAVALTSTSVRDEERKGPSDVQESTFGGANLLDASVHPGNLVSQTEVSSVMHMNTSITDETCTMSCNVQKVASNLDDLPNARLPIAKEQASTSSALEHDPTLQESRECNSSCITHTSGDSNVLGKTGSDVLILGGVEGKQCSGTVCHALESQNWSTMPTSDSANGSGISGHLVCCSVGTSDAIVALSFEQLQALTQGREADVAESHTGADGIREADEHVEHASSSSTSQRSSIELRFLLDTMCGRLCRWLRCLGIDAVMALQDHSTNKRERASELVKYGGGRVFLTRDSGLALRHDVGPVYLLVSDDPAQQMTELCQRFGIKFNESALMTRCSVCNAAELQVVEPKEAAIGRVPDRIYQMVDEFYECGACKKIFWMGPKSYSAVSLVSKVVQQATAAIWT